MHTWSMPWDVFLRSVKEPTTIGSSKINIHEKGKMFSKFDLIGKCLQSCSWVYDDGLFSDRLMHLYMQQMKVLQNYLNMCYIKR